MMIVFVGHRVRCLVSAARTLILFIGCPTKDGEGQNWTPHNDLIVFIGDNIRRPACSQP